MVSADQHIIEGILQEDSKILKDIYLNSFPSVLKFIRMNMGTEDDARDIFQDAMVVLYLKARKNPKFLRSGLNTYLFAICKYLWFNEKRRMDYARNSESYFYKELQEVDDSILDEIIKMEKQKLIWKHFQSLNEDCKKILRLAIEKTPLEIIREMM